jgi:hypothetical protein
MYLFQVLLKPEQILESATRGSPHGPDLPEALAARADRMEVYGSTELDGETPFYEFRLYRGERLLTTKRISGCQGNVVNIRPKRGTVGTTERSRPRSLRMHRMKLVNGDAIQAAITSINDLSALVGRHCYGAEPEEADAAQRSAHAAVRKLRLLKAELAEAEGGRPDALAADDENAVAA